VIGSKRKESGLSGSYLKKKADEFDSYYSDIDPFYTMCVNTWDLS